MFVIIMYLICFIFKVTELYDLMNKWDSFVDVVPDLVCVVKLHNQSGINIIHN